MSQTLVSSKYQVVIPKDVRRELGLRSGHKITCIAKDGIIHLIPDKPLSELRGFLKNISKKDLRDKKDRL